MSLQITAADEKGGQNMKENLFAVFEDYKIHRVYGKESETWYFSVVEIIQVLIQQPDYQAARNYWKVLKNRLNKEGSETVTKYNWLKLTAKGGGIAKKARHGLEADTGRKVVNQENFLLPGLKKALPPSRRIT